MAQYYSYTSKFIFGAIFLLFRSSCLLRMGVIVLWVPPKMPILASGRVVMAIVWPISRPYYIQNGSVLYMYFPIYVWVMFSTPWIIILIALGCYSTLGAPNNFISGVGDSGLRDLSARSSPDAPSWAFLSSEWGEMQRVFIAFIVAKWRIHDHILLQFTVLSVKGRCTLMCAILSSDDEK